MDSTELKYMFVLYSPLEQFEIIPLISILIDKISLNILTNFNLYLTIVCFTSFYIFLIGICKAKLIGNNNQVFLEIIYIFLTSMIKQQAGKEGLNFFTIFFTNFIIVLFSNLVGILPFSFTPTAQLILPVTLATCFNLFFFFYGFELHGLKFLALFVPKGTPIVLLPLIIIIEIVSYSLRTFSLAIRLFANMMAGHTLLHILSSFVFLLLSTDHLNVTFIVPFILVIAVTFLEIGIAFLQAYVFIILACIYLNDSQHPGH